MMKSKKKTQEGTRIVHINTPHQKPSFQKNYVRTAKYTIITFIPKNLIEQFMRVANLYFLLISGLQQIPGISPTGRWTTLGPLVAVLLFTAIKEAFEDIKRHRQDNEINHRKVEVMRDGNFTPVLWQNVLVGDIVKVVNRTFIPADIVILSTSETQATCYIETANLDGETNLKMRQALPETAEYDSPEKLRELQGQIIKCEHPNERLYQFYGTISLGEKEYPLEVKQTLLRGAMLRNTKWVIGIAVYTGHETKVMKNANQAPVKRSNVERTTNYQIVFMFCLLLIMSAISAVGYGIWVRTSGDHWYLSFPENAAANTALSFITFVILYNNLIPISLYVSVEFVKFFQAYFINNDYLMYHTESDTPALARTSNLNEELGQVQYIFSDKTGTLTCNKMEFKRCTIAGISYGRNMEPSPTVDEDNNSSIYSSTELAEQPGFWVDDRLIEHMKNHQNSEIIREAFTLLGLCHTVIPEIDKDHPDKIMYNASSPDEAALVKAAKYFGYEFYARSPKTVTIRVGGKEREYKLLNVLEFTNDRKRMSVILQTPEGKIVLYCKGADNMIYERLGPKNPYKDITRTHLDEYASEGLRTLCLAYTELNPKDYEKWNTLFQKAANEVVDRQQKLEEVAEMIEKNLFLLGASAVEDRLQDGVPETIALLAKAGIKIWILTGDKQETAINIGNSCKLLLKEMDLMIINRETKEETRMTIEDYIAEYSDIEKDSETLALVIDGYTLQYALQEDIAKRFLKLAVKCKAVICCRVSPGQKAQVVTLVRENLNAISLAIGDGANDVSMIQAAHVGIGISGEEGLQAARASDYAIAQFRFLKRLLLVHGRQSYRRISKVILYSFYRNILLYFVQFWFTFFNGFSGQPMFERWTLAAYNVVFTFFPVIVFGSLDKDVDDKMMDEYPQLYMSGQRKYHFNMASFWGWIINAIFQSFIVFALPMLAFEQGVVNVNGEVVGLWSVGTLIYTCVLLVVTFKLCLEARNWTWLFHLSIWGCLILWLGWLLVYSVVNLGIGLGSDFLFVPYHILPTASFWFVLPLTVFVAMGRDYGWKFIKRTYISQPYHIVQEIRLLEKMQALVVRKESD